jgi:hypothetical protein
MNYFQVPHASNPPFQVSVILTQSDSRSLNQLRARTAIGARFEQARLRDRFAQPRPMLGSRIIAGSPDNVLVVKRAEGYTSRT